MKSYISTFTVTLEEFLSKNIFYNIPTLAGRGDISKIKLNNKKINSYTLDGDSVRNGLNKDLGFSDVRNF